MGGDRGSKTSRCKREWLSGFLKLPGGIPSHDTFNRVFSALDPGGGSEKGFAAWVSSIAKLTGRPGWAAIDGKALRGTSVPGKRPSCIWFRLGEH